MLVKPDEVRGGVNKDADGVVPVRDSVVETFIETMGGHPDLDPDSLGPMGG